MTDPIRVAAVQLNSRDERDANLDRCSHWVARAKQAGANLVLLPENFAFFGSEDKRSALAERLGDETAPIQLLLSTLARRHCVAIVAGGWPEASGDPARPHNTLTVYDEQGERVGHYRKIHMFDVELSNGTTYRESGATTAGDTPAVSRVAGTTLGLSICYDLRFPELYRSLVDLGAEVLCVPSAFTAETGRDHWVLLNRARAVESQCWVVAANQWGSHGRNRQTYGHSLVVDPWGTVVAEAVDREGFVTADIDLEWLRAIRSRLPALQHRRLGRIGDGAH